MTCLSSEEIHQPFKTVNPKVNCQRAWMVYQELINVRKLHFVLHSNAMNQTFWARNAIKNIFKEFVWIVSALFQKPLRIKRHSRKLRGPRSMLEEPDSAFLASTSINRSKLTQKRWWSSKLVAKKSMIRGTKVRKQGTPSINHLASCHDAQ